MYLVTKFETKLLQAFVRKWKVEKSFSRGTIPDLIIPVSYVTCHNYLTKATEENFRRALRWWKCWRHVTPKTYIVTACCEYPFKGAAEREWSFKQEIAEQEMGAEVNTGLIRAADMNNSVQEAQSICLTTKQYKPEKILIITGELHTRSALLIWQKIFPKAEIAIESIPYEFEYQLDHPVKLQTDPWRWVYANLARHFLLSTIGVERTGNFRHDSRHE